MENSNIFILDGARTPIGSTFKNLKDFSSADLASFVVKELFDRNKLSKDSLDELILGNVVSAGTGQNLARQTALLSGLSNNTIPYVVNNVCASSLLSIIEAARAIKSKEADLIIAGGTESASHCPYLINRKSVENFNKCDLKDSLVWDGLLCQITNKKMGDIVEQLVQKYNISREDQDKYAYNSHKKACLAQENNFFQDEIIPVKKLNGDIVIKDDRPRKNIDLDKLANLSPSFKDNGSLTAGNSSSVADAASAVILMSEKYAAGNKKLAKARIVAYSSIFIDPEIAFESAVKAIETVLQKIPLSISDIDLFEVCEAFAAQALFVKNKLKIPEEKLNIYGGDIALGHPLGSTGSRMLVTLMHALIRKGLRYGLCCVSFGGGGAVSIIIENINFKK